MRRIKGVPPLHARGELDKQTAQAHRAQAERMISRGRAIDSEHRRPLHSYYSGELRARLAELEKGKP